MLYLFDLGNVIVNVDFNRVLGVWSDQARVPLAQLQSRLSMGEIFHQHERGEIDSEQFATRLCDELGLALSFEQFSVGWHAIFAGVRTEVITLMKQLREKGERVVILSNSDRLQSDFWLSEYPEVQQSADKLYLSYEMGMRKLEARIFQQVLKQEGFTPEQTLFFDDNLENIDAAKTLGITSIHVTDDHVVTDYFSSHP